MSGYSDRNVELDQILVPGPGDTYETYPLLTLLGFGSRKLRAAEGFGLPPLHFITQRGPYQDGETALDMRLDTRVIQIVIAERICTRSEYWDRRYDLLDLLRPNRSFNGCVRPLKYRKWMPGGKVQRGSDMSVTNANPVVTSVEGRFIHWGLDPGKTIDIGGVTYTIEEVQNDYTLILTANYAAGTDTNVAWSYRRGWGKRDLYCLLEQGPSFNEGPGAPPFYPNGYWEVLRFVAHDPVWYGEQQYEEWAIPDEFGDLVFDGSGAWLGTAYGVGRWLFLTSFVGETVSLVYWGTVDAKPTVSIVGPATNPLVENTTTGARIQMDYSVALGETVIIDTLALMATNQAGDNLLPFMSGDLASFGLVPAPQAPNRQNEIYVSFSDGVQGQSAAYLTWHNRYIGI